MSQYDDIDNNPESEDEEKFEGEVEETDSLPEEESSDEEDALTPDEDSDNNQGIPVSPERFRP